MVDTTVNHLHPVGDAMHGLSKRGRVAAAHGASDPEGRGAPDRQRRSWSLLVLLSVAQFMVILDATVVNVALPSTGFGLVAAFATPAVRPAAGVRVAVH